VMSTRLRPCSRCSRVQERCRVEKPALVAGVRCFYPLATT
jgi:hypothetical protein